MLIGTSTCHAHDNRIEDNHGFGVLVGEQASPTLEGNTVANNRGEGIAIEPGGAVDVVGNVVEGNWLEGIRIAEGASVRLRDNVLHGNEGHDSVPPYATTGALGLRRVQLGWVRRFSSYAIARSYNAVRRIVETIEEAVPAGATVHLVLDVPVTVTRNNLDVVLPELRERLATYGEAIEERGFARVDGAYDTLVTHGCEQLGVGVGTTRIDQDAWTIQVVPAGFEGERRYVGTVVGSALEIEHAMDWSVSLLGWVAESEVVLRHPPSGCRVVLIEQDDGSSDAEVDPP